MKSIERLLAKLDEAPWGVLYRIAVGICIPEVYFYTVGDNSQPLAFFLILLGMLGALRIIPALMRRLIVFSEDAQAIWKSRRMLAKRNDSYQWKKIFWFGLGIGLHAIISAKNRGIAIVFALACMVPGAVGLIIWRSRIKGERERSYPIKLNSI